jgi:LacI family transcriptional regulator
VTVSLALRNDPRITVETRDRVQALAKRAGYQPDPHVAELMGRLRTG